MNKLQCFFAAASLVLAALVVLVIIREHNSQWRPFQEKYKELLQQEAENGNRKQAAEHYSIGVRQDWLPAFQRADRCRTCHIGIADPKAPESQPLAPHPGPDRHAFREFGCTVCHGGEGYATRLPDAHKELLPQSTIESSCAKCHDNVILRDEAPTYFAGQQLAERYNCNGCHQLANRERRKHSGPDLNGLATKVSADWLARWLKDPKQYLPHARMGNFLLAGEDIQALTAFLTATQWRNKNLFFAEEAADEDFLNQLDDDAYDTLVEDGKVLFGRARCLTCHSLHGRGGTLGPELEKIGLKTTGRWISAWLQSPSLYDEKTIMPTFRLSRRERLAIAEYIRLESADFDEDQDSQDIPAVTSADFTRQQREQGGRLFVSRGCFNCHGLEGVPDTGEFAPSLADLAGKKTEKIAFGSAPVEHTLPDYISAKLQSPRIFGDNLKMPFFDLPAAEVGRLTTFALAQSSSMPTAYDRKKTPLSDFQIGGAAGLLVERYRCLSCHSINGRGGTLAPDLTAEGSKVQREWLIAYLQKPYAIRPTLVERMLRFSLNEKEATQLADYIVLALRDNALDRYPVPPPGDAKLGKSLFYTKYACQNCHALGTGGGYFGPALDRVGRRLTENWLHARLENVHRFEKDASEPVLAIPEKDRAALVAFLATLKGQDS